MQLSVIMLAKHIYIINWVASDETAVLFTVIKLSLTAERFQQSHSNMQLKHPENHTKQ